MSYKRFRKDPKKKVLKKGWFSGFFPVELFDGLKRRQLYSIGSFISFILIISPIIIWLSYKPASINNPIIALAKFNAFMAISTLSINFFLSTRLKYFERIFNGLDKMYSVHKIAGRVSLIFILFHPSFLIISRSSNFDTVLSYIVPIGPIEIAAGVVSVYFFLILIALTVAIKIPYHWWHNSHKILGIVLFLAGFHAVFAGSDIAQYSFLRFWIIFLCSLGMVSWIYMLLFYKILGPKFTVSIKKVHHYKEITEIMFKKPNGFDYQPGQFLFIRFPRFEGYKELFPFSISSEPSQKDMRISIKRGGDYTSKKIPLLKKEDKAIIMGPYGTFGDSCLKHDKDMLWIAGGIGITPFLSLAKYESKYPSGRKIILLWAIKDIDDAFHNDELLKESYNNSNFEYIPWFSNKKGRINIDEIVRLIDNKIVIDNVKILLCGPSSMMYVLSRSLHRRGVSYHNIIFEDFNMLD